jgi:hypothetical protein
MSLNVDGITVPDSQLAREITDLVRDTASPLLFHQVAGTTSAPWPASLVD